MMGETRVCSRRRASSAARSAARSSLCFRTTSTAASNRACLFAGPAGTPGWAPGGRVEEAGVGRSGIVECPDSVRNCFAPERSGHLAGELADVDWLRDVTVEARLHGAF